MSLTSRFRGGRTVSGKVAGPRSLSHVLDLLVLHARKLQVMLVVGGVLGLCLVPLLERRIEFDENALLAGSARPTISFSNPSAFEAGKDFADSLQHTYNTFLFSSALQDALTSGGFDVSNHTFRTSAAAAAAVTDSSGSSGSVGLLECVNVHAVLHSPRGDGKEAVVLVTPINHQHFTTDFHQDASGIRLSLALGYALMTHLARASWLSKELIWLLPDSSCGLVASVQAWTDVYQLMPLNQAGSELSFKRAGVLQQALLMELPSGAFNRVQVGLEGHAGQLPKLDMYFIYRWYSQAYVTGPVELPQLQPHLTWPLQLVYDTLQPLLSLLPAAADTTVAAAAAALHNHLHKLQVMWQFMGRQAQGLPTGAHAAFKGLGVDAATLRVLVRNDEGQIVGPVGFTGGGNGGSVAAGPIKPSGTEPYSHFGDLGVISSQQLVGFDSALLQLGNVMEASLRSCSGLIERFHHSLFLYVLTGLDNYVSVERYIGPLVAFICVLVLQAAYISSSSATPKTVPQQQQQPPTSKQATDSTPSLPGSLQWLLQSHALHIPSDQPAAAAARQQWMTAVQLVALVHALAVALALGFRLLLSPESHHLLHAGLNASSGLGSAGRLAGYGLDLKGLGLAAGLVLSVVFRAWSIVRLVSSSSSSKGGARPLCLSKVLVAELSVVAAVLAAIACINWALGYMACLVLVPLALVSGTTSSSSSTSERMFRLSVLTLCSPLALLMFLAVQSPDFKPEGVGLVGSLLQVRWLQGLICGSSWGTCLVACGLYVPFWLLVGSSIG